MKGFVKAESVAEILEAGFLSGQNVVLYGPPGYGKSAMAEAFFRMKGIGKEEVMVKACSIGTSKDDLFGSVKYSRLKEGVLEYNTDYSVFSKPYLILEEGFDAPVRVLEALKDVLTSKEIRNGHQVYPIKTKFIIVCTNRSKADLVTDQSSAALMERFPLSLEVVWDTHRITDYRKLIKTVFNQSYKEVEYIINYCIQASAKDKEETKHIAPRTVVRMCDIYSAAGIDALRFLDGIPYIDRAIEAFKAEEPTVDTKAEGYEKSKINALFILRTKLNLIHTKADIHRWKGYEQACKLFEEAGGTKFFPMDIFIKSDSDTLEKVAEQIKEIENAD